jgi:hypothetical protein
VAVAVDAVRICGNVLFVVLEAHGASVVGVAAVAGVLPEIGAAVAGVAGRRVVAM